MEIISILTLLKLSNHPNNNLYNYSQGNFARLSGNLGLCDSEYYLKEWATGG